MAKPAGNDKPRYGQPAEETLVNRSIEIPASALGPPRNEAEAASPAFQAMRMLSEQGIIPGYLEGETPPQHFESVEPAWAVSPPSLVGPLHGRVHETVRRSPDWTSDTNDPDMPEELREQLLAGSIRNPDEAPVRENWTAGQVLSWHTELTDRYARPPGAILDYIRFFVTDAYRKNPERAQGMFYPADLRPLADADRPDFGTAGAQQVAGVIAKGLRDSVTYQVTGEMVSVMRQVHDKTMAETSYLDEAELPAPAGFAWLDKPWPIVDASGNWIPIRVLTWQLEYAWASMHDPRHRGAPARVPCVRVGMWTWMDDDVLYGRWHGQEHRAQQTSDAMGELTFMHIALLPFGAEFAMPRHEDGTRGTEAHSILGILHTLWMFLGMEIVSTEPATDIPRLARRHAERSLKHGQVRVVTLRKIKHAKTGDVINHQDIDWSCRWVVQGHWRHIDKYEGEHHHAIREVRQGEKHDACAVCASRGEEARVTWISPYMKGPDGAPLKAADKLVYRLSR